MTTESCTIHPDEFHVPDWDYKTKRPVVDGKYNDPKTGELRAADFGEVYSGPPAVDLLIMSVHEDSSECIYRSQRPFSVEKLLCHIMSIVHERKLEIDSVVATQFSIRIILAHTLTPEGFYNVADSMSNGIWNQE